MTSFVIIVLLSLLLPIHVRAQQLDTLIYDQFNDNQNGWRILKNEDVHLQIKSGQYQIARTNGAAVVTTVHRFMESEKDFIIRVEFSDIKSIDKKGIGLVWGRSDEMLLANYFLIFPDKSFIIGSGRGSNDNGKKIPSKNSIDLKKTIVLRIEQRKGDVQFFCNDIEIHRTKRLPFFGMEAGILSYQTGSFKVDDFLIVSDTHIKQPLIPFSVLTRENLGYEVNSRYAEIHPIISADARTLYYARKNSPDNIGGVSDKQDIWYSTSTDGLTWTKGKNLGRRVNTTRADNLAAVTLDNSHMMFYHPDEKGKGGFRFKSLSTKKTDLVLNLGLENESEFMESCTSPAGDVILFTAKTKSNVNYQRDVDERDLYVCRRTNNGWSKPVNLGKQINSAGDEYSPFLAADGRTLYFGTNGRPGYGRVDIFMSKRLDDSWVIWSQPVNLGREINTPLFDAYYTVPASGEYAYLVSLQESTGDTDLIRVKLPTTLKPEPVLLIKGKVSDASTKQWLDADVLVYSNQKDNAIQYATVNGGCTVILNQGMTHRIEVISKGYHSQTDDISTINLKEYAEEKMHFQLLPLKVGDLILLRKIYFEQSKATLLQDSYHELQRLVHLMKMNPELEIEIAGHTDNVGRASDLMELSRERAEAVKKYLIRNGITPNRMTAVGFGATRPLVKNDSEELMRMNRRVEFRIIKN